MAWANPLKLAFWHPTSGAWLTHGAAEGAKEGVFFAWVRCSDFGQRNASAGDHKASDTEADEAWCAFSASRFVGMIMNVKDPLVQRFQRQHPKRPSKIQGTPWKPDPGKF